MSMFYPLGGVFGNSSNHLGVVLAESCDEFALARFEWGVWCGGERCRGTSGGGERVKDDGKRPYTPPYPSSKA